MTRIYYSADFTSSDYAFDTTRKAKWIADSLDASPIDGIELSEPASLTEDQLAGVHSPEYIDSVRTGKPAHLAESQGFTWDSKLSPMSLACSGGVVAAALTALTDKCHGGPSSP